MALKMVMFNADLSQVEARVELLMAAATPEFAGTDVAKECIRLATAHPADFDIHTWSAATVFACSEADVKDTDDEPMRYLGKRTMHGFMRGMGANRLADLLLVDGVVVTPETCEQRLGRLHARIPAIQDGFFVDVRRQIMRYRALGTTWGGIWRCDYQKLEEPLYGKGYSYPPVRETVDLINQCGFLPLRDAIKLKRLVEPKSKKPIPRLHVHCHDSLTGSAHPDDVWAVFAFVERTLGSVTRNYAAGPLRVPVSYGVGNTWLTKPSKADYAKGYRGFEWNKLPSYRECRDAAWACAEAA